MQQGKRGGECSAGKLRSRALTAAIAAPVALLACLAPGGIPFLILVFVCFVLAVREALALLPGPPLVRAGLAVAWLAVPLGSFTWIRLQPFDQWMPALGIEPGARLVALILLTTWSGDTAAYFVGRCFGRHKLAPSVSPGKTWEGAIANLSACALVALAVAGAFALGFDVGLVVGITVGVFGQLGDLFESAIKRRAGVKDSGGLFPGHGGILDRIDSLLLPAPIIAGFLWLR